MLEAWRKTWREGIAPQLSTEGLKALALALETDDPRLLQGATTTPPQCVQDWPVEAACGVGYCGWQGDGLETVAEVEEFFARVCFEVDQRLGEPAACRWFLNWFDETPRDEMRLLLLAEVELVLTQRGPAMATLFLLLDDGTYYQAQRVDHGWRLVQLVGGKRPGASYMVRDGGGCDCPDAQFRARVGGCKHEKACREAGLVVGVPVLVRDVEAAVVQ